MKRDIKKVVLAYSGGLDTSVILKWLQETYRCEVVTFDWENVSVESLRTVRDAHGARIAPPVRALATAQDLDLGSWGALYTIGWDRQVYSTGHPAKVTNRPSITIPLPRRPGSGSTGTRRATSEFGSRRWITCLRACPRRWAR